MRRFPYVSRVTSNLKAPDGEPYTHDLGPYTLILGPNESGKTGLAQSIQLAVAGEASGMPFRDKTYKSGNVLLDMGTDDGIDIKAELSTGDVCSWVCPPGSRPAHDSPAAGLVLPVTDLRAAFNGKRDKALRFLCRHIVPHREVQMEGKTIHVTGADLVSMAERLEKRAREAVSAAKLYESAIPLLPASSASLNDVLVAFQRDRRVAQARLVVSHARENPSLRTKAKALVSALGGPGALKEEPGAGDACIQFAAGTLVQRFRQRADASKESAQEAAGYAKDAAALIEEAVEQWLPQYVERADKYFDGTLALPFDSMVPIANGHTAISGSTENRVMAALAAALAIPGRLAIVVLDDRQWDRKTLAETLRTLDGTPCQVVVMSTEKPHGRLRSSWTVVELGA